MHKDVKSFSSHGNYNCSWSRAKEEVQQCNVAIEPQNPQKEKIMVGGSTKKLYFDAGDHGCFPFPPNIWFLLTMTTNAKEITMATQVAQP